MVRAVRSPFRTLRAAFNALLLPTWTVLCVTVGVIAGTLTRDKDLFYRWQRGWGRGLFRLCGIELEVSGEENMQRGVPYVIVANHASYMDVPALFATLSGMMLHPAAMPTLPSELARPAATPAHAVP